MISKELKVLLLHDMKKVAEALNKLIADLDKVNEIDDEKFLGKTPREATKW